MRGRLFPDVDVGSDVGGFTVEQLLGQGGCGAVFQAWRGGQRFALKLQPLAALGGWAQREVAILIRLAHPNVVRFHACGLWPDSAPRWFYLAMELVEGRTLERWVDEENPSARRVAELARDMARGLAAAHAEGVLHRDVKECNVVVREATGQAVLVDFGVGTYPGAPRLTLEVLPPGTPLYRSPEALAFRKAHADTPGAHYTATAADDLYALGVVLYWALTGRHPFPAPETYTEVEAVLSRPPLAPLEANPRVPPALGALCLRLLAKQPEERLAGAAAVAEALEALLAGADAAWEAPLCESRAAAPAQPPAASEDEDEAWLAHGEEGPGPPRRGRLPVAAPLPGPPLPGPDVKWPPLPVARPLPRHRTVAAAGLVVLTACLVAGGVWVRAGRAVAPRPSMAQGREVAPISLPPEAGQAAAAPPRVAATPAAVTPRVAHAPKEEFPMKKPPSAAPPPSSSRFKGPLARAAATALVCGALTGCPSGPQLRPAPPAAACPDGAKQGRTQLGLNWASVYLGGEGTVNKPVRVREGRTRVLISWTRQGFPAMQEGWALGELFVGQRVYGRFTQIETETEGTVPVCLELREYGGGLPFDGVAGIPREPGSADPDTAIIRSDQTVRPVLRFE
ncbi:MAG TPA: serine/threonine-protein kinase [Myxococcus sp.]|nr:serine/threonine-protein kinase [Myxococcus sp.]